MKSLLQSRWLGLTAGAVVAVAIVAAMVLVGDAGRKAFFQAPVDALPLAFIFLAWAMVSLAATIFTPTARRGRRSIASLALLMFSSVFLNEIDTVTLYGLAQALGCCAFVTWLGFGRASSFGAFGGSNTP
ncbi:MAG: hypothetical protein Q7T61_10630 [Caulobacter sp.]|nr:hypothetical protein [Caulobacter sp.]